MRLPATIITATLLALCGTHSYAEIYKTVDEDGNTVFTDTPPATDAEKVEVQESNIADSVEVREYEPAPQQPARREAAPEDDAVQEGTTRNVDDDPDIVPIVRKRPLDPPRRPVARPHR